MTAITIIRDITDKYIGNVKYDIDGCCQQTTKDISNYSVMAEVHVPTSFLSHPSLMMRTRAIQITL
jgi:hypothetical protein